MIKKSEGCDACRHLSFKMPISEESLNRSILFRVYDNGRCRLHLCYAHSLELWKYGERRFLGFHIGLANEVHFEKNRFIDVMSSM